MLDISVVAVELRLMSPPALIAPSMFITAVLFTSVAFSAAAAALSLDIDTDVNFVVISDAALTSIFFVASSVASVAILRLALSNLKT